MRNKDIARAFIERAAALGYKGKRRDNAALEYITGALCLAKVSANVDDNAVDSLCSLLYDVSHGGADRLVAYANEPDLP